VQKKDPHKLSPELSRLEALGRVYQEEFGLVWVIASESMRLGYDFLAQNRQSAERAASFEKALRRELSEAGVEVSSDRRFDEIAVEMLNIVSRGWNLGEVDIFPPGGRMTTPFAAPVQFKTQVRKCPTKLTP
jgi:hypothetical protein